MHFIIECKLLVTLLLAKHGFLARRVSLGWGDESDDTALQTQYLKVTETTHNTESLRVSREETCFVNTRAANKPTRTGIAIQKEPNKQRWR